jgi:CRISPR-associated endonuclease Cas2
MLVYLACYDVSNDRLRTRIAAELELMGMVRIQLSVFVGPLTAPAKRKLTARLQQICADQEANVLLIPFVFSAGPPELIHVGNRPPDWGYLTNQINTLVL